MQIMRSLLSRLVLDLFRVRVIRETRTSELMKEGPVILACNHVSFLDGFLLAFASPQPLVFTSETMYSKRRLDTRLLFEGLSLLGYGWILQLDGTSPMGIRAAIRQLALGRSVLIFPEGRITRYGEPSIEKPGLAWLASRSGAPVVRLRIQGAEQSRLFAKSGMSWWPAITIHF